MKKKNQTSHTNRYILLGLSLFCALMMVLSSFSEQAAGPFKVLANITVIPLQQGINHVGRWLGDMKDNFSTMQQLRAENEDLQAQIDALTTENNYLQEERYEYERLQELYQLDQSYMNYETTGARVIGRGASNWFDTFTIDKGSDDGIREDMNVIAGGGLVGIVTDVQATYSVVRTVINDTTNISGMTNTSWDHCIVSGSLSSMTESNTVRFSDLEDTQNAVSVGDAIVTSNISDKYLPGILIGYITTMTTDSNDLTKSGTLTPVVDFKHLQDVLIITQVKDVGDNGN